MGNDSDADYCHISPFFSFSFLLIFFLPILLSVAATYIGISITVAVLKLDNGGLDLVYTYYCKCFNWNCNVHCTLVLH